MTKHNLIGRGTGLRGLVGFFSSGPVVPNYDYLIENESQWTSVFGLSDATLAGKRIAFNCPLTPKSLSSRSWATPPTLVGLSGNRLAGLTLASIAGITLESVYLQQATWPKPQSGLVVFSSGTFGNLTFDRCTFRGGYGAGFANFDRAFQYPEYTRVDNVTNATTTTSRIALTFQDPAATDAWVEFFNRGTQTVYFRVGNSAVVATAGDTAVPAGTRVRSASFNPQTNTHIAVLSASGTQQVNARAEIGMSFYLTDAFASAGNISCTNFIVRGCEFLDVSNACKQMPSPTSGGVSVCMDSTFRRVYQDIVAGLTGIPGVAQYVLRNVYEVPFARSGIPENENGDARDPHGDVYQSFGGGTGTIGPGYMAGNVGLKPPSRAGTGAQGMFANSNVFTPSYDRYFNISNLLAAGAPRGISMGTNANPHRRLFVFGTTVFDPENIAATNAGILTQQGSYEETAIMETVSAGISAEFGNPPLQSGNVIIANTASPASCFPSFASYAAATDRASALAAMTTAAEAAGKGAVANQTAIDWGTADYAQVIRWGAIPSGVVFSNQADVALSSTVTWPLRRVLNERASQTVVPFPATEWRTVAADGTTQVQGWTSLAGSVASGHYIQMRRTASASNLTAVAAGLTINGFDCSATATTVPGFTPRAANFNGLSNYANVSVAGLTGSSQGMMSVWFRNNASWAFGNQLCEFRNAGGTVLLTVFTDTNGRMRFNITQNGTGSDGFTTANSTFVTGNWYHVLWSWSWSVSRYQIYVNNVALNTAAYLFTGATQFDLDGQEITRHGIGSTTANGGRWNGDIGHFYVNFASSLDLSVQANREKFALAGSPVNLGDNGSLPTGSQPAYYWDGIPPGWDNKGVVASGTLSGSLAASGTAPSY